MSDYSEPIHLKNNEDFSNNNFSEINQGYKSSDPPLVVNSGDMDNKVLIPALVDVIQNCITINKYETAYPENLVFETNLCENSGVCGRICITDVFYSYDSIGVHSNFINGAVGDKYICLSSSEPACCCMKTSMNKPLNTHTSSDKLFNEFKGTVKTECCCCDDDKQSYTLIKIVEKGIVFAVYNLNIIITGTIGGIEFTANLIGIKKDESNVIYPVHNLICLSELGFPHNINLVGGLNVPVNTKLIIRGEFDNSLTVDNIRPINQFYQRQLLDKISDEQNNMVNETDLHGVHWNGKNIKLTACADLSLIINNEILITTTEKAALLSNSGSGIVCKDSTSIQSLCSSTNPCVNQNPCTQCADN